MAKKRTKKGVDRLRDDYRRVNSLFNLGVQREQQMFVRFQKLLGQGKRIPDRLAIAHQKLRAKLEQYGRERERLLKLINQTGRR